MPRNESGQYTKPPGTTAVPNTTIASAPYNALQDDMADALTESLPRTGVAPMLADLPMSGNKITGLGDGADSGDAVNFRQLEGKLNTDGGNWDGDATAQAAFRVAIGANLLGGFRNKLLNPTGSTNQRKYVSGAAAAAANQYTIDRWRVVTIGQSLTWTGTVIRTMTAPAGGVEQPIEGYSIEGGTYVLNWEGTATAEVNGVARVKGEAFTLPEGVSALVRFIDGTFSKPQLELGESPTVFELRYPVIDILLCKAYYQRLGETDLSIDWRGYGVASQAVAMPLIFPVPMRTAPTATIVGAWAYTNFASLSLIAPTATSVSLNGQLASTGQFAFRTNDNTDHIELDAELHT